MSVEIDDDGAIHIELEGEEVEATEYSIGYSVNDGEIRLQFHNSLGTLSSFVTDATGAYELANRILRAYDKLEGIT